MYSNIIFERKKYLDELIAGRETRGLVPVSWTTLIHTKRYSLTVDSFQKRIFCVTNNR